MTHYINLKWNLDLFRTSLPGNTCLFLFGGWCR